MIEKRDRKYLGVIEDSWRFDMKRSVHVSHCCVLHGCKYDEILTCPVVNLSILQEALCEECCGEVYEFRLVREVEGELLESSVSRNLIVIMRQWFNLKRYGPVKVDARRTLPWLEVAVSLGEKKL